MSVSLDLEQLRAFCEVAETRSFTKAAARLHRVQSAVSAKVKCLEAQLGVQLFERNRRRVTLTPPGERLLQHARRMLRLNVEIQAEFRSCAIAGTIRAGVTGTTVCFLAPILKRFSSIYPRIEVQVICDLSFRLLEAYDKGHIDLALVTQDSGRQGGDVARVERLVWVAAAQHCAEEEDPLPLAVFGKGCIFRDAVLRSLDATGRPWRIAFSSPSNHGVLAAISSGVAIGAVAQSMVLKNFRILGEREGLPELPSFDVRLFWNRQLSPEPVQRFAAYMLDFGIEKEHLVAHQNASSLGAQIF